MFAAMSKRLGFSVDPGNRAGEPMTGQVADGEAHAAFDEPSSRALQIDERKLGSVTIE